MPRLHGTENMNSRLCVPSLSPVSAEYQSVLAEEEGMDIFQSEKEGTPGTPCRIAGRLMAELHPSSSEFNTLESPPAL